MVRKALISLAATAVAILAITGCGGSGGTKTVTVAETTTVGADTSSGAGSNADTSPTTSTRTATNPTDCDALGINPAKLREGPSSSQGEQDYVVNKGNTAHLASLDVSLQDVRSTDSVSDPDGMDGAVAKGKFIIATVTIYNKLHSSQSWDSRQSALSLAAAGSDTNDSYDEAFDAENGPDQKSCIWKAGAREALQPGMSTTCDLIYDVPKTRSADLAGSYVMVGGFGVSDYANSTERLAVLRTYH